jgi:two-component system nitrogen regulation response regulator NtrX
MRTQVVLVELSGEHRAAFSAWAEQQRIDLLDHADPSYANSSLCVIEMPEGLPVQEFLSNHVAPIRKLLAGVPTIILTHGMPISSVVELVQSGIRDIIELPASGSHIVAKATAHIETLALSSRSGELVGGSAPMRAVRDELLAVAPTDSIVLLTGETGTGKDVAARLVHDHSRQSKGEFVHVNLGELASSVFESELFGHERGAFTGASGARKGKFELAARGTIFLDEIGEVPIDLQPKLLRVIHDRRFTPVGGTQEKTVNARIIAATNKDLAEEVRERRFRRDLFHRLTIFDIHMPALRERLDDLPALVENLVSALSAQLGMTAPRLSDAFFDSLRAHPWNGNVRELRNLLERMLIRHEAGLFDGNSAADFFGPRERENSTMNPASIPGPTLGDTGDPEYDEEHFRLEMEMAATGGNVSRMARRLGIPRSTLRYRLHTHNLEIPQD